ncbi:MAG TPA: FAD-binding protein, partial [Phycisphaerae bacterium]|nr:FAD-binding protein [Phycisphaerae bacterium]
MNWFKDLPDDICKRDVPLGPLTWFKLGGPADFLIEPRTETQLSTIVRRCQDSRIPLHVLGLGANLLVPDEGVRGVVLRLSRGIFPDIRFDTDLVFAGGGFDMTRLVKTCVKRGLAGLEQIAGIPGTLGGGIAMNCGGRYGEIGSAIVAVRVMSRDGEIRERSRDELRFSYRHAAL